MHVFYMVLNFNIHFSSHIPRISSPFRATLKVGTNKCYCLAGPGLQFTRYYTPPLPPRRWTQATSSPISVYDTSACKLGDKFPRYLNRNDYSYIALFPRWTWEKAISLPLSVGNSNMPLCASLYMPIWLSTSSSTYWDSIPWLCKFLNAHFKAMTMTFYCIKNLVILGTFYIRAIGCTKLATRRIQVLVGNMPPYMCMQFMMLQFEGTGCGNANVTSEPYSFGGTLHGH